MPDNESHAKALRMILELGQMSQASTVLLVVSQLEDALERRIRLSMPKLSNTMRDKLFSGYGPFAAFSVRIDVAYAMGRMSKEARDDFHVIRDIRNKFAHPRGLVHFQAEAVGKLVTRFHGYKKKEHADHFSFFLKKIDECWEAISPSPTPSLASYLKDHYNPLAGKPSTLPEKS